jgi:hypothetical protein
MAPPGLDVAALVAVARNADLATPDALASSEPAVHCLLTLPRGCTRPDAGGAVLIGTVIAEGGAAFLAFEQLADALAAAAWCRAAAGGAA